MKLIRHIVFGRKAEILNKVIVISGITKGLGAEIYNTLTDYNIAGISRNTEEFENDCRLIFKGDISNPADVQTFFNKIGAKWGKIDVLINNAGIVGDTKSLIWYDENELNEMIDINIKGTFFMVQESILWLYNGGLIINIGSTRSITGAPKKSIYTMTKFALRGLTQCINAEYNPINIYSTIICPGNFLTVDKIEVAKIIKHIIELPIGCLIPEIVIGGMI